MHMSSAPCVSISFSAWMRKRQRVDGGGNANQNKQDIFMMDLERAFHGALCRLHFQTRDHETDQFSFCHTRQANERFAIIEYMYLEGLPLELS